MPAGITTPVPWNKGWPARHRENDDPSASETVTPDPDNIAGEVFAYRGMETHGIESETRFDDVEGHSDTVPVEFEEVPEGIEPIPVIVVNESRREIREWGVNRTYANANTNGANRIVGRDDKRTALRIRNIHASVTVWVAPEPHLATPDFGYPIPFETEFVLDDATQDIWAMSADGNVCPIAVVFEYIVNG